MESNKAIKQLVEYILDTERDDFYREWAPENLQGITLKGAYKKSATHPFMLAVIACYGDKEFRKCVRESWKSLQKVGNIGLTEEDFYKKYTPNKSLKSEHFDSESGQFETFGNDLKTVLAQEEKFVWTCIDGDYGTYFVSGYHFVNRIYYLITNEEWVESEEYLLDQYSDDNEED